MDVEFDVTNQIVTRKNKTQIPVDCSSGYLVLKFNFKTTDWNSVAKCIFFKHEDTNYRYSLTNDKVTVPTALLTGKKLIFGLYGTNTNTRITTNPVILHLLESKFPSTFGTNPSEDYSQDEIEEIYTLLQTEYYTRAEVDALIDSIENKLKLTVNKTIIQDDETATLTAQLKQDGFAVNGATIKFYSVTEE